ncbi:hypothetical protein [Chryseobacterium proteolyticum]|uniref:hypothetical protein n=1 Tax=Chryseobacterium proteolyticum TaxID=118127 RepID=UPI003983450F
MKETWAWIWKAIQEVYAFLLKPFAAFMIVIVAVVVCWYISDQKYDNGYQAGIKNQKSSDSINVTYQEKTIKSLERDRDYYKQKSDSMDCAEETRKAVAYIESVKRMVGKENQSKSEKIKEFSNKNRSMKTEISNLESLIPKNKKQ